MIWLLQYWKIGAGALLVATLWGHGYHTGGAQAQAACDKATNERAIALQAAVAEKEAENAHLTTSAKDAAITQGDAYAQNIVALHKFYTDRMRLAAAGKSRAVPAIPVTAGQPEVLAAYDGLAGRYSDLQDANEGLKERCAATTLQLLSVLDLYEDWERLYNGHYDD